jgi:hypothetical protein
MKEYIMNGEEEPMHSQHECLMKAGFLLDVLLIIVTFGTKPLSHNLGRSKTISMYGGEEKVKGA